MTPDLFVIIMLAVIAGMSIGSFVALLWCEQHLLIIAKTISIEFISKHLENLNKLVNNLNMDGKEESTDA